jgi:Na+-translocating ferredoxin:NAD+ oxidoreductase subunit D
MKFSTASAPHWRPAADVPAMMRQVLYALAPAAIAYTFFFGPGLLVNTAIATAAALATEALALRLRGHPQRLFLSDGSAVVTAVLLAFCLPPLTPWWVTVIGAVFAVGVAKHIYGGLGFNVFNPAMAGYAVLLVSFPAYLTFWLPPQVGDLDYQPLSLLQTLYYTTHSQLPDGLAMDAVSRATPLDIVKTDLGLMRTMSEIVTDPVFGDFGGRGWEWIGNFITLGGAWLLYKGIIRWQIPFAMIASLMAAALLFYLADSETHASPMFHLYAGGTLLGAFFIATDPVSSAVTDRGRLIYGAGCGLLTFGIRAWGSFPDGVAFAVLLMNMAVPLIDRYTRPRIYGH